jgi:site-specific recombinase XerD
MKMKSIKLEQTAYRALYASFIQYIHTMGYSKNRDNEYANAAWEFMAYLEMNEVLKISEMTNQHVIGYQAYLSNRKHRYHDRKLSSSTIQSQFNGLRQFFHFLNIQRKIAGIPKHVFRITKPTYKKREIVSQAEIKLMYLRCTNYTELAILCCAYGCGLRQSEIIMLSIADIDLVNRILLVRKGKFGKSRVVPLTGSITAYFRKYIHIIRSHNMHESSALFINRSGRRVSGLYLNKQIRNIIYKTQYEPLMKKHITLHCLRHSIATHMIDTGASIVFAKDFLGHKDINTTNGYAIQRNRKTQLINRIFS